MKVSVNVESYALHMLKLVHSQNPVINNGLHKIYKLNTPITPIVNYTTAHCNGDFTNFKSNTKLKNKH